MIHITTVPDAFKVLNPLGYTLKPLSNGRVVFNAAREDVQSLLTLIHDDGHPAMVCDKDGKVSGADISTKKGENR
jgi:hypothetical protein